MPAFELTIGALLFVEPDDPPVGDELFGGIITGGVGPRPADSIDINRIENRKSTMQDFFI
jgi:hypothetical protein